MSVFQYPPNVIGSGVTKTITTSNGTFTCNLSEADNFYLDFDNSTAFTSIYATPTYVGGTSATFLANALSAISLTSLTGGIGTAPQAGDIVIVAVAIGSTSDLTFSVSTNGYTSIAELYVSDTYDTNLEVSYKVMGSTPDTSVSISITSGVAADAVAVAVHVWRGIDNVNPLDATPTTVTATNTIRPNPPAITTVTDNAEIIIVGASSEATAQTLSAPAGYGDIIQATSASTNDVAIAIASASATTAGAYDPGTFSTASNPSTASAAAFTIALRPGFSYTAATTATIDFQGISSTFKPITIFGNFSTSANPLTRSSLNIAWDSDIRSMAGSEPISAINQGDSFIEYFNIINSIAFASTSKIRQTERTDFITSTQTWTAPFDVSEIEILLCGGGSGGTSTSTTSTSSNSGGSGSVTRSFLSVTPGASYTVTIGAGGATDGGNGGASSFGALLSINGATDAPAGFGGDGYRVRYSDSVNNIGEAQSGLGIRGYGTGGNRHQPPANTGRGGDGSVTNGAGSSGIAIITYWSAL